MSTIILQGKPYSYTLTRKPITSITLRLKTSKSFVVSAPFFTPLFIVEKFLQSHADWIITNSKKVTPKKSLKSLKYIEILDKKYELIIKKSMRDSVVIFKEEQKIYANVTSLSEPHLRRLLDAKMRSFALSLISSYVHEFAAKHDLSVGKISVKNTRSRFGSCSSQNNLNFNWQIILLPKPIFLHIIFHELAHTVHHNHSSRFWDLLRHFDPETQTHRQYLKKNAPSHFIA